MERFIHEIGIIHEINKTLFMHKRIRRCRSNRRKPSFSVNNWLDISNSIWQTISPPFHLLRLENFLFPTADVDVDRKLILNGSGSWQFRNQLPVILSRLCSSSSFTRWTRCLSAFPCFAICALRGPSLSFQENLEGFSSRESLFTRCLVAAAATRPR